MKTKTELFKQFDKDILNFYKEMVICLKENHNQTPDNQSEDCMSIEDYTVRAIWLNKACEISKCFKEHYTVIKKHSEFDGIKETLIKVSSRKPI